MNKKYKKIDDLKPPALTARENQFSTLTNYFQNAMDGKPSFVLLKGEEGLGKSRLVAELKNHKKKTHPNTIFLEIKCEQDDHLQPFWRIAHAVFRLFSLCGPLKKENHVGTPSPNIDYNFINFAMSNYTEENVENIFFDVEPNVNAIYSTISGYFRSHAQKQNICVIVEDIHNIDRNSAEFFVHFLNDIQDGDHLLVTFCYHGDESSGENGLQRVLPKMYKNSLLKEIKLLPFLVRDIPTFVTSILNENIAISTDLATTLYKNTKGNPYKIQAFVQGMVTKKLFFYENHWKLEIPTNFFHQLPKDVEEMLISNLDSLGKYQQEILQALSIVKRSLDLHILSLITGLSAGQMPYILEELIKQKYIYQENEIYNISSTAIREKVISSIQEKNFLKLNIKIAKIMEKQKEKDLPFIADLYFWGQEQKKALLYGIEAGKDFHEQGLFNKAISYYDKCLPLAQTAKKHLLAKVLISMGFLHYRIADYKKALCFFSEATASVSSEEERNNIAKGKGLCQYAKHNHKEARDLLRNVQKKIRKIDNEILSALLSIEVENKRFIKANSYLEKLTETKNHSKILQPFVLKNRGEVFFYFGKWDEAKTSLEEALVIFKKRDQIKEIIETNLALAELTFYTKGVTESWEILGELNAPIKSLDDTFLNFKMLYLKAFLATELNEWEKAIDLFDTVQELGKDHGDEKIFSYGTFGLGTCALIHERNAEKSHRLAAKTLEYANDAHDTFLASEAYHLMAKIYLKQKNFSAVQQYSEYSKKGWKNIGLPWKKQRIYLCIVRLMSYTRNAKKGLEILGKIQEKAEQSKDENLLADLYFEKGMIFYQHQKKQKSKEFFSIASKLFQKQSRHYQYKKTMHFLEKS